MQAHAIGQRPGLAAPDAAARIIPNDEGPTGTNGRAFKDLQSEHADSDVSIGGVQLNVSVRTAIKRTVMAAHNNGWLPAWGVKVIFVLFKLRSL